MNYIHTKPGVEFSVIAPGGFALLAAIYQAAQECCTDLVITSGTDSAHSGPNDPHHRGEAYDVRTHDFSEQMKEQLVASIRKFAGPAFHVFLESPGTDNEHVHCQVCKGTTYP